MSRWAFLEPRGDGRVIERGRGVGTTPPLITPVLPGYI